MALELFSIADCVALLAERGLSCSRATVRADSRNGYLRATAQTKGRRELLFMKEDAEAWADSFVMIREAQASKIPERLRGKAEGDES